MSQGARKAACLLASIGPADRSWLLGQLAPEQRATVEGLIEGAPKLALGDLSTLLDALARDGQVAPGTSVAERGSEVVGSIEQLPEAWREVGARLLVHTPDRAPRLAACLQASLAARAAAEQSAARPEAAA